MPKKTLSDRRGRHDHFHKRARARGFSSRAIFKLEEIDQRHRLIHLGARVLDLGCFPGSWLEYAANRAGDQGRVVGLDRTAPQFSRARILEGDVFTVDPAELLGDLTHFDVVLSDMAPDTIGVRHVDQARSEALFERALDIAEATLATGGAFVGKLFQGPDFQRLLARCRGAFDQTRVIKPDSSRKSSIEQYVIGIGYASTP